MNKLLCKIEPEQHYVERKTAASLGLTIWPLKRLPETFVQDSTVVILLNFIAKKTLYCQAEKQYRKPYKENCKYGMDNPF